MKDKFAWYFPLTEDQKKEIWNDCLLTVDANVLLDLYRYHEITRNSIVSSLKVFKNRLWLSNQAAVEFIRNRNSVIVDTDQKFSEAEKLVKDFQKELTKLIPLLQNCRILPEKVSDKLNETINSQIEETIQNINLAQTQHPKYLKSDPILDEIITLFGNSIGEPFKKKDLKDLNVEAETRIKNKIPPGFFDQKKDGEKSYGDFFLWRQILQHSKEKNVPIIFVTTERKEDWWERYSGTTIGQRPELLQEAHEYGAKKILIYTTKNFVENASAWLGKSIDERVVEDIKAVDIRRSETELAVELIQQIKNYDDESIHTGEIILILRRPVRNFTVSGSLKPRMKCIPDITGELSMSPVGMPSYIIRAGAGTIYDFNLHVISTDPGTFLPVGEYILYYEAICREEKNSDINND